MLQRRAMLANLTIHAWTARKQDKRIAAEVEKQHGAKDAGNYNKMLVEKDALKPWSQHEGRMRDFHYKMTLPWGDNGDRLLPGTAFFDYTSQMRQFKDEAEQLADDIEQKYPGWINDARVKLGSMFDVRDYPAATHIRKRFGVELSFLPVPDASDFRVDVGEKAVEEIKASITKAVEERQVEAMKECWLRLQEAVTKIEVMMSKEKPIFRDSLIDNARELTELLPKLNITNDADLIDVCDEIQTKLLLLPNRLRYSSSLRAKVAEDARAILVKINDHV